ncbi:MAG: type II toxin-antitoxin system HicB family antitoxin [bacterium]
MALANKKINLPNLPVVIEKYDGWYVVECPILEGCYSQGKTLDEALSNIREVIRMILAERGALRALKMSIGSEISIHSIAI